MKPIENTKDREIAIYLLDDAIFPVRHYVQRCTRFYRYFPGKRFYDFKDRVIHSFLASITIQKPGRKLHFFPI